MRLRNVRGICTAVVCTAVVCIAGVGVAGIGVAACAETHHSAHNDKPAAVLIAPTTLTDLNTIVVSETAHRALGLEVAPVQQVSAARHVVVGGEVMVPAGRDVVLAAPASGRVGTAAKGLPKPGERVVAGQVLLSLVPMAPVDRDRGNTRWYRAVRGRE